ncbi:unnamed protein product [Eretmochelys imbricata]
MAATEGADLLAEPLLHNPQLRVQVLKSPSVCQRLVLAEVTRAGDLLGYDRGDWLDPLTLTQCMRLSRPRTPQHTSGGALLGVSSTRSCKRAHPAHCPPQALRTFLSDPCPMDLPSHPTPLL